MLSFQSCIFVLQLLQVEQRDVPGIDSAFLAMDTEEGMEVVWNEVYFSENKNRKAQQVMNSLTITYTQLYSIFKMSLLDVSMKESMVNCCLKTFGFINLQLKQCKLGVMEHLNVVLLLLSICCRYFFFKSFIKLCFSIVLFL